MVGNECQFPLSVATLMLERLCVCVCVCERVCEREGEGDRDRETHRERETEREREGCLKLQETKTMLIAGDDMKKRL